MIPEFPKDRPPDWRWQTAAQMRAEKRRGRAGRDDPTMLVLKTYQMERASCKGVADLERLERRYPAIFEAERIYAEAQKQGRFELEARLLSRQHVDKIAARIMKAPPVILWYERAFFNVIPFLPYKSHIINNVIRFSVERGLRERDFDVLWKLMGYMGGPNLLDLYLNPAETVSRTYTPAERNSMLTDSSRQNAVKANWMSWATIPIAYNQNNVIQLFNELVNIERQAGNTREAQLQITQNIHNAIMSLPFSTGSNAIKLGAVATKQLEYYDKQGIELRDHELIAIAMDKEVQQPQGFSR